MPRRLQLLVLLALGLAAVLMLARASELVPKFPDVIAIAADVKARSVVIQARDRHFGYRGSTVEVALPR